MQWPGLLPLFRDYTGPVPGILVIHLGGNDLGFVKGKALVFQALRPYFSTGLGSS